MPTGHYRFRRSLGNVSSNFRGARPDTYPRFTGLLDTYGGAAAAYSLRALSTGWLAGDVVEVRRSSDSASQNFTASQITNGNLVAFCGVGDGFVSTWYDQSGNGRDATQATTTSQPKIVNGGALIVDVDGLPTIKFDGSNDTLPLSSFPMANTSVFAVNLDSGGTYNSLVGGRDESQNQRVLRTHSVNNWRSVNITDPFDFYNGGKLFVNGNDGATTSYPAKPRNLVFAYSPSFSYNYDAISSNAQARVWNGDISELIIYPSDQSANRTAIEANINAFYSIYWDGSRMSLLDYYPSSSAAYSLRALNSAYVGALVEVRRSSDGAKRDIYANYDGSLDVGSLLSFTGAGNGFVSTWYDQSGNGNDATQATTTSQPKIVNAGALVTGGLDFDGVNNYLDAIGASSAGGSADTSIIVAKADSLLQMQLLDQVGVVAGIDAHSIYLDGASGQFTFYAGVATDISYGTATTNTTLHFVSKSNVSSSSMGYINGVGNSLNSGTAGFTGGLRIAKTRATVSSYWNGTINEVIIYHSDQSANRTAIEANINEHYSIY